MKSMWKLLSDSPARRDEYLKLSVSGKFPLKYCAIRWVENEDTAEGAMLVWPDIILLINHFLSLSKSKQPKNNKSYDRLVKVFKDKLVSLKLMLFKEISAILNGFLRPFQTDNRMVPFLSDAYEELIRKLMKMFLLRSTVDGGKTRLALLKIDLNKMDTRLPLSQLRLLTAVEVAISTSSCPSDTKDRFKKECISFIIGAINKWKERLPIKSLIVLASLCLSPEHILNRKFSVPTFEQLVDKNFKLEYISSVEADAAKLEFPSFIIHVRNSCEKFSKFNKFNDSLDLFLGEFVLPKKDEFKKFWKICIFIFTQSHGQSQVERGFNINKNTLQDNLLEKSLIGRRLIYDEVKASGKQPHNFEISNGLVSNCKTAHARYSIDLAKNKENQAPSIPKPPCEKRKLIHERILDAKRQKMSLESCIEKMEEDADKYFVDTEKYFNP